MNQRMLRVGRLAGLSVVLGVVLAALSGVDASAAVKPDSCPTNKPLVVDSYVTFENSSDSGADGHIWALDSGTRSYRIWRLGGDAYCAQFHDFGTFTTFAGVSPEGTGTVSGGVTGSFDGTFFARINGTFAPTVATTGFIGNFDPQCQQDGSCPGPEAHIGAFYFSNVRLIDVGAFAGTYDAGPCGTWFASTSGDRGDIVC